MRWVEPRVFKIAETRLNRGALAEFLTALDAQDWMEKQPWFRGEPVDEGAALIEIAGRACYKSFGVELNPNLSKIRGSTKEYLTNVLSKGDGSVIEHSATSWVLADVSRVFTHELIRHRVGTAISQESLRYVRPRELRMSLIPGSELTRLGDLDEVTHLLEAVEKEYLELADKTIRPGMDFETKKGWTSALRRILPDGIATNIVWTANHRTLRWVLEMRTDPGAEAEMRYVFDKVGQVVARDHPDIYGDFERVPHKDGVGAHWIPKSRSKV
jgi:thymidylate synthase (FAD)